MPDDAERALLAAGKGGLVERLRAATDAFVAEHRVAIETLRDDAHGDLRQGGPLRALGVLLLFPLALPLGVYIVRNVAGMEVEWLGAVCSILCVLLSGAVVVMLRGRPLDRTSIGQQTTATVSVVAGAVFAWTTFGAQPIAIVCAVSAAAMLGLLAALLVARVRHREVGRLRDIEATDRADALRGDLRARLEQGAGSSKGAPEVDAFADELVRSAVPRPKQRLFADNRPLDQRGPQS